ncbi:hypothetical protein [Streptomyces sp. NPDC058371]|uniref:hypothetical protein n=1 Tax=Streptomyces sp. NPDC058371 TaxID=3346463 RepID=UPI003647E24F
MTLYLGPLELVGDRWIIGDPKSRSGSCVVLTAEGVEQHERGSVEALTAVPWSRFMSLGVRATPRAWQATRTGGIVDGLGGGYMNGGRSGCSLQGLVHHPYHDWSVNYAHHERPYSGAHVFLVQALFQKVSDAKALHRLGDPGWLADAVARTAPLPAWYAPSARRRVNEIVEELGT